MSCCSVTQLFKLPIKTIQLPVCEVISSYSIQRTELWEHFPWNVRIFKYLIFNLTNCLRWILLTIHNQQWYAFHHCCAVTSGRQPYPGKSCNLKCATLHESSKGLPCGIIIAAAPIVPQLGWVEWIDLLTIFWPHTRTFTVPNKLLDVLFWVCYSKDTLYI